jgi:hypothetical protein
MVREAMPWRRRRKATHGRRPEAGTGKANEARQDKNNNRAAFIGLITALITLGVAVVPLIGQLIHLSRQVHAQASSISSQSSKIRQLQHQTVPNAPEGGSYLSNMNPISDTSGYAPTGVVVTMGGIKYPHSLTFNCTVAWGTEGTDPPLIYSVSGAEFTAVIGFSDADGDANPNVSATVTITDQTGRILGDRVIVTPDHPLRFQQPLTGVTRLGITCSPADELLGGSSTPWPRISLANASV